MELHETQEQEMTVTTITRSQMRIWLRNEKKQAWNDDDDGIPMIDAILEELKKLDRMEAQEYLARIKAAKDALNA